MANSNFKCRALVVKVASRCNLNCSYCYMYNMGDETYKKRPKIMSKVTIRSLMKRVQNHCLKHNIKEFMIILHGGEPMLCGINFYEELISIQKEVVSNTVSIIYAMQTNGILLSGEWCDAFARLGINVGISMDGTPMQNNKYRVDHAGRGSYPKILSGLRILQKHPIMRNRFGVLSVVDVNTDPVTVYNHFKKLRVQIVNFLLPDSNYIKPPPEYTESQFGFDKDAPFGDWLCRIFDLWYNDTTGRPEISFFTNIIMSLIGEDVGSETLGNRNNELLVIETDGSIEAADTLRICGNGITNEGINVDTTELDDAFNKPLINLYYHAHTKLCKKCESCEIVEVCGGGFIAHRYDKDSEFNNPSVYCKDLLKIIIYIQNRVFIDLPKDVLDRANITIYNYNLALQNY